MKNNKGITIISLIITIVVLIILAGITVKYGTDSLQRAELETLRTNMLLIKAKTMECVEQANFKAGTSGELTKENGQLKDEISAELKGQPEENTYSYIELEEGKYLYDITSQLNNMGLKDIKVSTGEKYLVVYDIKNANVEIYNTQGIERNGTIQHSLTGIQD